jgi:endonuclease YncB( thermonuclease family)
MKKLITLFLLLILPLFFSFSKTITGKVIKVSDGDTFTLQVDKNTIYKVRINEIDCPEKKQAFGTKATKFTNDLIYGKYVKVEYDKFDRYGRILGTVKINNKNVSEELIKNGLAWHYYQYSKSKYLSDLENEARLKKINIWSDKKSIAPWEYRKNKKRSN